MRDTPSSQSSSSDTDYSNMSWNREDSWQKHFPKVNISATIESGQAESTIKVPKQRNYTGHKPAIPSAVADIPCATLGVHGVLNRLNAALRTSHTLDTPSVLSILEDCIVKNYDFGTAYGRLRDVWSRDYFDLTIEDELRRREKKDKKQRRKALVRNKLEQPPRRVWDLFSNRVVPYWTTDNDVLPISHAWVDEANRTDVLTPINGREWPVPIPKDASLDLIRIEMLNLGGQYVWLDVLCLRQKGGPREDLRGEEWTVDVPTIGHVYTGLRVVIYLNGLGRPLHLEDGDLESDRCWFRRAWTLQESGGAVTIAGDTPHGPLHANHTDRKYETQVLTRFHEQLRHVRKTEFRFPLFRTLADMRKRASTNPVDRVAGLAYCLQANHAYHESETPEDAWTALVNGMPPNMRAFILFLYPGAGLGSKKWCPSWQQVMSEPLPADLPYTWNVDRNDRTDEDWYEGPCIKHGLVRGLSTRSVQGVDRGGELVINGTFKLWRHTYKIRISHQCSIPDGVYTLLGSAYPWDLDLQMAIEYWVVGRSLPGRRFEKVSVIRIPDERERNRLDRSGIVQWGLRTYLL